MGITLEQLLTSRDARQQKQQELLRQHPYMTLICLTVVMPGCVKRNHLSLVVAKEATDALQRVFEVPPTAEYDLETGYEAYFLTPLNQTETKHLTCKIEETHPLGRLFDLDVIGNNGIPVSRNAVGMPPRRCLLCDNEVRFCMRNHTHTQEEIYTRIQEIVTSYTENIHH